MREFDWGARRDRPAVVHDRVLTVANGITALRLLGLPLFVWLLLDREAYGKAFTVIALVASTDWIDGYVARRLDQVTKLGKVLDPLVDRLLMATVSTALLLAGFLPWPFVALLVLRDVVLLAATLVLYGGIPPIGVTRTGKVATAALMLGLPSFLLGGMDWAGAEVFLVLAWLWTTVGLLGYYVAGVQYARAARRLSS